MSTVIYSSPIFGPVHSRRLGLSLGINLMPADGKVCTFDCIYCECGYNSDHRPHAPRPTRQQVAEALERQLRQMVADGRAPDVLTFAGNGEPTAHPDFAAIIDDTLRLRDALCPQARVSVLSNATLCHRPEVRKALMRVDDNIQKLDTVNADFIRRVDRPTGAYDVERVVEALCAYDGHVIVQSMFLKGTDDDGHDVDNTGDAYVMPWLDAIDRIRPRRVMVYTIDRETPCHHLQKATHDELDRIVNLLRQRGHDATASY